MITLDQYITADNKYPERLKHQELTDEIKKNAEVLLKKVNDLLKDLNIEKATVSSGWRPSDANSAISNAAKKSLHMQGKAIDILDNKNKDLCKLVESRPNLLIKYDLWMEDPTSTTGKFSNWTHIDIGVRKDRPIRIFKP